MPPDWFMHMSRGIVFEIREFCVHDGPGVRTTVFLKGCPLRCVWCQNPEGQSAKPELLFSASRCMGCGNCRKVCPHGCDSTQCEGCGACATVCPERARRLCGTWYDVETIVMKINRHREFLLDSGGVTFSGGEPLMQGDFVCDVAEAIRPVQTAIETCGQADATMYRKVISHMDVVYQDLKLIDSAAHETYTGVRNEQIVANIRWLLAESGKPCVIRVPLIPGVTDTAENLQGIAAFVAEHRRDNLQEVQLLPYNFAAGAKYALQGREYAPPFDPNRKCVADLSSFVAAGVPCRLA